ncbi:MAG: nucleoside deaminase [Verrucomicrobiales bacterium]|nr:nucleoside deaminase [Verrucomicrobiales bacterium]
MNHETFMDRAIRLAREAVEAGDGPAGCVLVDRGQVVGEARNRVFSTQDPTAHAELLAIRAAAARLGRTDLSGLTLYTTLEPCPMCCGALFAAKISTLVLGARYSHFRTRELGTYSVEELGSMTGRSVEIISGIREAECRELRYEALQRSVRQSRKASGGNPVRGWLRQWERWWTPTGPGNARPDRAESGRALTLDSGAGSADPSLPAFVSRPEGAPVYHGFPVVAGSEVDGWSYGSITAFDTLEPQTEGDGFVIAPDGRRAGIAWATDTGEFYEILPPDPERWGVYGVRFPMPVQSRQDLITCFHEVLPQLKRRHAELFGSRPAGPGDPGGT